MYARRQPDEDIDEDDMDDDELVRLVDQTSDESISCSDAEEDTVKELEKEPTLMAERIPAAGADASVEGAGSQVESDPGTPERMYKLVLAGNAAVGKSSFIIRLCKNKFYSALNSTLG